jgi:amino acid adenylation domain-containing protein/thioester reductase-like protein
MDGGLALPVAMIAAMEIGAPFVPVDPSWPEERIRAILSQLRPKVAVTAQPGVAGRLPGLDCLSVDLAQPPLALSADPWPHPAPDDLIYGFFTSGSTGTPKCALNQHRGLLNRFQYMTRRFSSDGRVVLQNSHHVFDSSIWQFLWPLTIGGQVVIPDRHGLLDLERTIDVIARYQVTTTDFVPSIFNTLMAMLAADPRLASRLTSLRRVLIGGEAADAAAVRTLHHLLPGVKVTNTYGPTEASIGSVLHDITAADGDLVPIGRPIDNTYAVILDDNGEVAPSGQLGEIYIGGDCLGAGYLGDPQKTAAAFVPNPLPQIPGTRLYRTGDLGYQRADGLFMFAGRTDDQVKVGGVRIELGEVEIALAKHPAVRQAKVVIHGEALTGFAVADPELTPAELTEYLRTLLPGTSVPRRIVVLDRLPLTPNGKLDRQELARLARRASAAGAGTEDGGRVGTDVERAVKKVWLDLLARDDVGMTQSLFEVGGDSLTAHRLALALQRQFGVRVTVRDVVSAPTIRDLASLVAAAPGTAAGRSAQPPPQSSGTADLLSYVQLAEDVRYTGRRPSQSRPDRFLLTGATGFVGAQLLCELAAQRPDATIYCLIRADGPATAQSRLAQALSRYLLPGTALRNAVAVPGDLSQPRFGLGQAEFNRLAKSVGSVIHNGALVNLVIDFASHCPTNVAGTAEIVRFAALSQPKHLHYVSTLSVLSPPVPGQCPAQERDPQDWPTPGDGYSQSKWVAEKILVLARSRGIPSSIYRLGDIMPRSGGGPANPRSTLDHLLRACVRTGLRFATPAVTDWTPVDTVSRLIAAAAAAGSAPDGCLHALLPASVPVDRIMDTLAERTPLREVPYPEFWASLDQAARGGDDRDLLGLLSLLPHPEASPAPELLAGVFTDAARNFAAARASRLADELGVPWPTKLDDDAVADYCGTVLAAATARPAVWHRASR